MYGQSWIVQQCPGYMTKTLSGYMVRSFGGEAGVTRQFLKLLARDEPRNYL